jgi:hypothetical protein
MGSPGRTGGSRFDALCDARLIVSPRIFTAFCQAGNLGIVDIYDSNEESGGTGNKTHQFPPEQGEKIDASYGARTVVADRQPL